MRNVKIDRMIISESRVNIYQPPRKIDELLVINWKSIAR